LHTKYKKDVLSLKIRAMPNHFDAIVRECAHASTGSISAADRLVWTYLYSNFHGELRKMHIYVRVYEMTVEGHPRSLISLSKARVRLPINEQ